MVSMVVFSSFLPQLRDVQVLLSQSLLLACRCEGAWLVVSPDTVRQPCDELVPHSSPSLRWDQLQLRFVCFTLVSLSGSDV